MEKTRVPEAKTEQTSGLRARLGRIKVRGYYWPVRTIVQLGFFILFSGIGIMSLIPAFNGTRSWIVLPIVSSVKSQAQVTSTMDAITLFLENGLFPWLPLGIMLVVGAILGRFMCGWICPVGFLQDVITSVKGRVDSVDSFKVCSCGPRVLDKRVTGTGCILWRRKRLQNESWASCRRTLRRNNP